MNNPNNGNNGKEKFQNRPWIVAIGGGVVSAIVMLIIGGWSGYLKKTLSDVQVSQVASDLAKEPYLSIIVDQLAKSNVVKEDSDPPKKLTADSFQLQADDGAQEIYIPDQWDSCAISAAFNNIGGYELARELEEEQPITGQQSSAARGFLTCRVGQDENDRWKLRAEFALCIARCISFE